MSITAAIFDFDGTIVESDAMWNSVSGSFFARHGVRVAPEDARQFATLTIHQTCALLVDKYHVDSTAEALYEEFCAELRDWYVTKVPILAGCHELLDELLAAGVTMVIATTTPAREVRTALAVHGLDGHFLDIVSNEDLGCRDKRHPDVYLEALGRLDAIRAARGISACELSDVWVFEDAPFAIRTAHEAGFHVVGIVDESHPRHRNPEKDVRPYCDIMCHGYPELSLSLINDFADRPEGAEGALDVLVVDGSPCPSSDALVAWLAGQSDYVIAVDRGAEVLMRIGAAPDVFCGDSDSVSPGAAAWAREGAKTTIAFPSEKYATDLAIAIGCAEHEAGRRSRVARLTVTCASGGRPDHAFAVVGLLANHAAMRPRLVEDGFEMCVLGPGESWELGEGAVGKTFSAVAVAEGTFVSECGMRWELDVRPMALLDDMGVSNVVVSADAAVTCHEGVAACWLFA